MNVDSDDLGSVDAQCKRADDAYNGSQWTSLTKENYHLSTSYLSLISFTKLMKLEILVIRDRIYMLLMK